MILSKMPQSTEKKSTKKVVKKPTPKVSTPKSTATKKEESSSFNDFYKKKVYPRRGQILVVVGILIFVILLIALRTVFIAAMVNGQPITRLHLIQELEKQQGKQVLDQLVTKKIIEQEASKKKVSVSDDEVQKELKSIEDRVKQNGQSLDQLLVFQGLTRRDLEDNIRTQKLVEKLAASTIQISDKEVNDYLSQNKEAVPEGQSEATVRQSTKDLLLQQKKTEAIQKWIQDIRSRAKVEYFHNALTPQQQ